MVFSAPAQAGMRTKRRRSAASSAVAPVTVILAAAVLLSVLLISLKTGVWREVSSQTSTLLHHSPFPTAGTLHRRMTTVTAKQLIRDVQSSSQMLSGERLTRQGSGGDVRGGFQGAVVVDERQTRGGIRANAMAESQGAGQAVLSGAGSRSTAAVKSVGGARGVGAPLGGAGSNPQETVELRGAAGGSAERHEQAGAITTDAPRKAEAVGLVTHSGSETRIGDGSAARRSRGEA